MGFGGMQSLGSGRHAIRRGSTSSHEASSDSEALLKRSTSSMDPKLVSVHTQHPNHTYHTWLQKRTINLGNTWIPGSKWMVPRHVLSSERAKQLSFDIRKRSLLVITGLAAIAYAAASSTKSAAIFTQVCCVILCDFSLVQFNEILELKSDPWAPCPFLPC